MENNLCYGKEPQEPSDLDRILQGLNVVGASESSGDEFIRFINAHLILLPKGFKALDWWCREE
jgi:hypothetical protein